ncbi:MAG: hypothetical protein RSD49_06710 [Hafnia sp.]
MIGIFLDDERFPVNATWMTYPEDIQWVVVRTHAAFTHEVAKLIDQPLIISFDHDLMDFDADGREYTGYDGVKWLVDLCMDQDRPLPLCVFHTQNPVGRQNMESYYLNALRHLGGCQQRISE